MKRVIALVLSISAIMLQQPAAVNAITDIDAKCIEQAYRIGYDLSESIENIMYACFSTVRSRLCVFRNDEPRCNVFRR